MNCSSQGRRTPDLGMMALSAVDPIMTLVADREGRNPQEPDRRFYTHMPEVHWHYHTAPQMTSTHDGEARRAIDRLADEAYRFGRMIEMHVANVRNSMVSFKRDVTRIEVRVKECEYQL